jgi:flagellar biosynthesis protein FlhF
MSATVPPATAPTTTAAPATEEGVKTFRGQSLEELLPQIREELGADAVILRQRDGLKGGVGGFFQKRCVEVDARAGAPRVDAYAGAESDDDDIRAALDQDPSDFRDQLDAAQDAAVQAGDEDEAEERFTRPVAAPVAAAPAPVAMPAPAPAPVAMPTPVFQPAALAAPAGMPLQAAEVALAEGLEAPAIRALFEAAAPFAEQLQMADAALPRVAEAAELAELAAPVAEAPLPAVVPAAEVEPVAPARPVQADTQELALVEGGLSPALAADVVSETVSHLLPFGTPRQLKRLVRQALARRIPVQGPRALGGGTLVLAGAGGSGKTLTVARLAAAYAAGSDLDVVVVALRPRDGGAELAGLLHPAGVPVEVFESAADVRARLADVSDRTLVLVDTPAISPGDEEGVKALAADLRRVKGEVHLCIPATLSAAAGRRLLGAFAALKPAGIALTHVDETPQVGAIVELAVTGGPALTFVGRDTGLEGGLELADPAAVAALVLP